MVAETNTRLVDPTSSCEWLDLVQNTTSTLFHSPCWMKVVRDTYGVQMSAAIIERAGAPVAGVAWSDTTDLLGPRRITLPYSDFCDILGNAGDRVQLAKLASSEGLAWTIRSCAASLPQIDTLVQSQKLFKWHRIDLCPTEEELWGSLSSMVRRGVRKAEKSGVVVRHAESKSDLREWFLLHMRLRKYKHHLLAQPYSFFEYIWDSLIEPGKGFLLLAVHEGKVIGGTLYLLWQNVCYYKFNASDSESLHLRPNNVLTWAGMLEAKQRGYRTFDFGRSNAEQHGLIEFKASFGATEQDLVARTYVEDGAQVENMAGRHLLDSLTELLISPEVPDSITEKAGAILYSYFK